MTKAQALFSFFDSFGMAAYESRSVPEDAPFPRITFDLSVGDYGAEVSFAASVWYRSNSLAEITDKTGEIARRVSLGGVVLPCDGGHIRLYCGTPWMQLMGDPDDDMVRRAYLNFTARYNTMP